MSIFLVQQDNATAFDYYVLNDILTFQHLLQPQESSCSGFTTLQPLPADKVQHQRIYKFNVNQPQQDRLTQEPIDPIDHPIAPCALPAAAPLPATTPSDLLAFPSPSEKSRDAGSPPSSKSAEVVSSSRGFQPVQPSHYPESSYAAKLLSAGRGGVRPPCQVGFAVPPQSEKVHATEDKQNENFRRRPGRGKTVWVSMLPSEMTDTQIAKAVAEQLKGETCEGHVVKIERVPEPLHGYIELDTELCARELLHKGLLYLRGHPVTVDWPGKGPNGRRVVAAQRSAGGEGSDELKKHQGEHQQQRRAYHGNQNHQRRWSS